ncbi:hypothetical protein [Leptolyngbya sp. FACHB-261]|uniref:hypothetical protein n=1 Tax=Leptolyngbya sp. FACHB-261 TaxID=2692806 RepID=UPI0016888B0F|nr:hypothetical protein [Leptolyngbya sp. FACHB-261]MBD2101987.1 hypothetical protein [Leptolyngbya sp. FACHB-261]
MTRVLADQCQTCLDQQRQSFVQNTLLLIDEWQTTSRTDPKAALAQLNQIQQKHRELFLAGQIDASTYIRLKELILLISIMLLTSKS